LFIGGIAAVFSPNFWGYNSNILLVVDIFFLVETGILAMLIALELPIRHLRHSTDTTDKENATTNRGTSFNCPSHVITKE
jgi:hypothetical protein